MITHLFSSRFTLQYPSVASALGLVALTGSKRKMAFGKGRVHGGDIRHRGVLKEVVTLRPLRQLHEFHGLR